MAYSSGGQADPDGAINVPWAFRGRLDYRGGPFYLVPMQVYSRVLTLRVPWTVAHGTSTSRTNVFVDLGDGIGEAPIVPYYPFDEASVSDWLRMAADVLADQPSDQPPGPLLAELPDGPAPARSALDVALHDRWARAQGRPLFELVSGSSEAPESSFTLSIPENEAAFIRGLERMRDWPLLKLKLGSGDANLDLHLVDLAKAHHGGRICVDANAGWDLATAVRMTDALAERNVVFIEEPLHAATVATYRALRERTEDGRPPILADESLQTDADLERLAPYIDGINVKLAKAGGIAGALRLIQRARRYDLKVLIGCMVESSVGVTAAAHLAPLADFADLDGFLQLADDPFKGVELHNGQIRLPTEPGLGVRPA